jgi:hypothetical protein
MQSQLEHMSDLARALERRVEIHAEAAKQAIREYKKSILEAAAGDPIRCSESQRQVERVVGEYIQLRKRLDEAHAQMRKSDTL